MAGHPKGTALISDPDEGNLGPAMLALNPAQRRFVLARIEYPGITQGKAAEIAGYSNVKEGAKVRGHHLSHNEAVLAAIHEVASKTMRSSTILAANVLVEIAGDADLDAKDRLKAAGMLLDRTGFGAAQTINVNKTVIRKVNASEAMAKIAEFREKFPLQFAKMIGSAAPEPIEGEFSEVSE